MRHTWATIERGMASIWRLLHAHLRQLSCSYHLLILVLTCRAHAPLLLPTGISIHKSVVVCHLIWVLESSSLIVCIRLHVGALGLGSNPTIYTCSGVHCTLTGLISSLRMRFECISRPRVNLFIGRLRVLDSKLVLD